MSEAIRKSAAAKAGICDRLLRCMENAQRPIMDEEHPLDPLSPYAVSKLAAEQMCKVYSTVWFGCNDSS